jgi:hypothetical protein
MCLVTCDYRRLRGEGSIPVPLPSANSFFELALTKGTADAFAQQSQIFSAISPYAVSCHSPHLFSERPIFQTSVVRYFGAELISAAATSAFCNIQVVVF